MPASLPNQGPASSANVELIHAYLEAAGRRDLEAAAGFFAPDLTYRVPGQNVLSGESGGQHAALDYFGKAMRLTNGTYRVDDYRDWMVDDHHVLLLAGEQARVGEQEHRWDRLVLFEVQAGTIRRVDLFEDDQHALDGFLGIADAPRAPRGPAELVPPGRPEMTGNVDDPRVRAIMDYQRHVALGDLDAARTIFAPDVEYHVSGQNLLAGDYHGADDVMGYFARLGELTDGTYAISHMQWLTSPERVGLVTRNHATRGGRSLSWDEVIVFLFKDGRKRRIDLFSGDQYGVDALFGQQA